MFGKDKKDKKAQKKKKGMTEWKDNAEYSRGTGTESSTLLEAQRMRRGGSTPTHYLRKKKR